MKSYLLNVILAMIVFFSINIVYAGGGTFLNTDFEDSNYSNQHMKVISLKLTNEKSECFDLYTDGTVEYYESTNNYQKSNEQIYYVSYDDVCTINQPFLERTRVEFFDETISFPPLTTDFQVEVTCYSEEGVGIITFDYLKDTKELNAIELLVSKKPINENSHEIEFNDIKDTKYEDAVLQLVELKIISGFGDGTFKPTENVTRGQLAKMIATALKLDENNLSNSQTVNNVFNDLKDHWAYPYIKLGVENGIIYGYEDGTFKPNKNVSYAECMAMLIRALDLEEEMTDKTWSTGYIEEAKKIGLFNNIEVIGANESINRGDTAIAIYNMLNYEEPKGTVVISDGFAGFITGDQTRDLSDYNSFSDWKEDLRKDMEEHNNKAEEQKNNYLIVAEKNAKDYIKNKYGFEPIFTDKHAEYDISMVGGYDDAFVGWNHNYSGNVLLKFNKEGKDYYVLISGKDGDKYGYDNYQYDTICKAVIDTFDKTLGVKSFDSNIKLGKEYELSDKITIYNLINENYSGNNLKNVISDSKIFLEYGSKINLQDSAWEKINSEYLSSTTELYVVKYKSDEEYKVAKANYDNNTFNEVYFTELNHLHDFVYDEEFYGYDLLEKALNIDSYLTIIKNESVVSKPQIGECDGIYLVQWNTTNTPVIKKSQTSDIEVARKRMGFIC